MPDAAHAHGTSVPGSYQGYRRESSPAWAGWIFFAGVMMIMVGSFEAIVALVALFNDKYYLVTSGGLVVSVDYTAWGWIHLGLGLLAAAAGVGVIMAKTWARVIGIILAALSAIANVAFMAAYPLWSMLVIAMDVIVIYALAVHGRDVDPFEV